MQSAHKPLVSILCLAYNQEKFIRQCLDSLLMQETDFNIEILVNDDASTDNTRSIIQEYQEKHPDIVKPVFHEKNQYSQGLRNMTMRFLFPLAKGEYIALCEGDDYWTDPKKLEKQVKFLDENKDYALCFHPAKVIFEGHEEPDSIYPQERDVRNFTTDNLLTQNFIQTNSVVYRKQKYDNFPLDVLPGDWFLNIYHSQFGKIGFINDVMSVYRRHPGGIWWTSHKDKQEFWRKYAIAHLRMFTEVNKLYGHNKKYKNTINRSVARILDDVFLSIGDDKEDHSLVTNITEQFPRLFKTYALGHIKAQEQNTQKITAQDKQIYEQTIELDKLREKNKQMNTELKDIKNSRVWKARMATARAIGRDRES